MNPQSTSILLPLLVPLAYAAALLCLARISGWSTLARRFPAPKETGPVSGRLWRGSLRMGFLGHYNSSVIWSAHGKGLRIVPWFHLRIGHPPIFLPWSELRYSLRSRLGILEGLDIHTPVGQRLWLPLGQAKRLRQLSGGRFWPATPEGKAAGIESAPVAETLATHRRG